MRSFSQKLNLFPFPSYVNKNKLHQKNPKCQLPKNLERERKCQMGFTFSGKSKSSSSSSSSSTAGENWGMGFLLVFFPEENSHSHDSITDQNKLFSSFKRNHHNLLSKAQSTISLCALLVFISLLLFTLSTFDPSIKTHLTPPPTRRFLSRKPTSILNPVPTIALQGMGTLFMRGTKSMSDLVVFHVGEDLESHEFRLFLRLLHRSGLTSKSDSVFLFPSPVSSSKFSSVIREENDSFLKLIHKHRNSNTSSSGSGNFDVTHFVKLKKEKEIEEPVWGRKSVKRISNDSDLVGNGELTQLSYGSIVGFEAAEIDPENTLDGFLDHVPMSLRRWACYPMLLGRVRRNFKHIMLIDLKTLILLGDPISRIRTKTTESVLLFTKHGRKNSVNPAIIIGGARGVRRLSAAVLVEIVRGLMQHKKKNSVSDGGILSRLVDNEFLLKNIKLMTTTESIPEVSSVAGIFSKSPEKTVVQFQRGNNVNYREISSIIMKQICMLENVDFVSNVYSDC